MLLTYFIILVHSKFQSDKASMLDEAIEYLKSLQLQVQVYCFYLVFQIQMFPRMVQLPQSYFICKLDENKSLIIEIHDSTPEEIVVSLNCRCGVYVLDIIMRFLILLLQY